MSSVLRAVRPRKPKSRLGKVEVVDRSRYEAILGDSVAVVVEPVTEIPAGPRGKRAVVVSKLAFDRDGQ